jgi:hypothetical protein
VTAVTHLHRGRWHHGDSALSPLSLFVHLNSDRTLDPVCQDSSFPEKQESQTALVLSSAATVRSAWSGMPAFPQE